jgi:PAS domain S-box-containing protein
MEHRDLSSPTPMPTILRYGIAVLSVALGIGLGFFLLQHFEAKLTPFLFAVAVTVWYAGTGPGVLAIVLSVLSLNYFFLRPVFSLSPISYADLVYLTFCIFCALAVGWVSAVRRRAEQELRQAREELEAEVVERTASLQRSEGYLAKAQSLSHTGSWVLNIAARETIHWSQETYRLYGFDPEEGIPPFEALLQRIHPEDRGRFVDDLETAIRERANHEMIFRAVLPDGTLKYILGTGHPVFNASGDVVEFVGAAMDITERKRAEVVGQRLAAIVDSSEDAIISKDLNGTIESWNGAAERLFGYQASEVIGKSILIIVPPDRHDEELGNLKRIGRGELIKPYETVRMREDGSLLDISLTVSPLRDAAGRIIGASKIARDITERKRAEDELRASEERFRTLVEFSFDVYWESDAQHRFIRQEFAEGLTDAPAPGSEIGKTRWEVPYLAPDEEGWRKHRETLDAHLPFRDFEIARPAPDGGKRYVSVSGLPVFDGAGRFIGYRGVGRHITERKKAESELRDSQTKLEAAQRIAHVGWWERDYITNRVSLSDEVCRTFGVQLPEWHGRWLDLIHPDDRARAAEAKAGALRGDRRYDLEYRVIRPDGSIRIVHSQADVTRDESGQPVRQFGVLQDITELRQTESELRESEARFRTLVQFSFEVYWETDTQHRFTRLEYAPGLVEAPASGSEIGKRPWELRNFEADAEAWRKHREAVDAHLPFRDFEVARRTPDGSKRYMSISGLPVFDESGCFVGYRGAGRDITERKTAEEALRRSEAYLAGAQELSHSAAFAHNLKENLYWSEGLYRIWGFDPSRGMPTREACFQRIHPDDRDRVRRVAEEAARQKQDYTIEYRIILPDGTLKHLRSICHPAYSLAGELVEVVGTALDVTERKRAQEEHERLRQLELDLAHMNRLSIMGELTASLAHEILHPIATARNNARAGMRFLEMSTPNLAEVMEALGCVVRDTDRAKDIVGRIRDQIKKAPPRIEPFDLNEAIDDVLVMVRSAIDRNRVSVRTCLMERVATVRGDRVQLQQVVLNLILNAVDAMSSAEEGARELTISTEPSRTEGILVAVRDSGPGINPEHLDHIFKPFHTTKTSGLGMGLSICRSIIDAHGGRLWAEANQPRGAILQFNLPAGVEDS